MPYREAKIEKLYYAIGEVADELDISTSNVRFWANKLSDIIRPHKNKKGNRLFTKTDVENLRLIYYLVREKGMTLEGARMKIKENKTSENYNFEIIQSLQAIKNELMEVKELL